MSELRWNPLLEQWVITATHRQDRTFFPPDDYCPLCPTKEGGFPTEVPAEDYEIVAFDNKFPSLQRQPPVPTVEGNDIYKVRPAAGVCEVILYSPKHQGTLTDMSVEHIENLIAVWTDRYRELGRLDFVDYVFIFENKGKEIGVTLTHPHGQIYAYPFIPPVIQKELDSCRKHYKKTKRCLLCDILERELADGKRIVAANDGFVAFIPFYARYPYEVHILARKHRRSLVEIKKNERTELARILKTVLTKYDNLWGFELPYMMVIHQKPTDGKQHNYYHFHIEFYPPYRTPTKLKFLAGSESGAGVFINDTLAEEKAKELREVEPKS
ncbi:MAG: galactose-1-phosphate uridylyltransferase [Armatimonadota bacterium]|nr:galactose-1-phosphate uridylyltransferase [Armatimonadota bacterium]